MQYQSDYVLRLIEQMGSLIRRALEKLGAGEAEEPYDLAQQALGLAIDLDPTTSARLSPASLVSLLEINSVDDRVAALVVEALEVEADALERLGELLEAHNRREQAQAVRAMRDPLKAN